LSKLTVRIENAPPLQGIRIFFQHPIVSKDQSVWADRKRNETSRNGVSRSRVISGHGRKQLSGSGAPWAGETALKHQNVHNSVSFASHQGPWTQRGLCSQAS